MYIKTPWFVIASRRELLRREIEFARDVASNIRRHYEVSHLAYESLDRAITKVKTKLPTNEEAVSTAEEIIKWRVK